MAYAEEREIEEERKCLEIDYWVASMRLEQAKTEDEWQERMGVWCGIRDELESLGFHLNEETGDWVSNEGFYFDEGTGNWEKGEDK